MRKMKIMNITSRTLGLPRLNLAIVLKSFLFMWVLSAGFLKKFDGEDMCPFQEWIVHGDPAIGVNLKKVSRIDFGSQKHHHNSVRIELSWGLRESSFLLSDLRS